MALQPTASGIVEYVADVVTAELQPLIDGAGTALANIDAAKVAAVGDVTAEGAIQITALQDEGAIQTANAAAQVALATTQAGIATTAAGTATTQAGLATTNGEAQVALAAAQVSLAAATAASVGGLTTRSIRFPHDHLQRAGQFGILKLSKTNLAGFFDTTNAAVILRLSIPREKTNQNRNYMIFGSAQGTSGQRFSLSYEGDDVTISTERGRFRWTSKGSTGDALNIYSDVVTSERVVVAIRKTGNDYSVDFADCATGTVDTATTIQTSATHLLDIITNTHVYIGWAGDTGSEPTVTTALATPGAGFIGEIDFVGIFEGAVSDAALSNIALGSDPIAELGTSNWKFARRLLDTTSTSLSAIAGVASDTTSALTVLGSVFEGGNIARQSLANYLTLDRLPDGCVFGCNKGETGRRVPFAMKTAGYSGIIDARIVLEDGSVWQPWTRISHTSLASGGVVTASHFVAKMPAFGYREIRVRGVAGSEFVERSRFGVGRKVAWLGQSQTDIALYGTTLGYTAEDIRFSLAANLSERNVVFRDQMRMIEGNKTGYDGLVCFARHLLSQDPGPLCVVDLAVVGTGQTQLIDDTLTLRNWSDIPALTSLCGNDISVICHNWGTFDAAIGSDFGTLMDALVKGTGARAKDHWIGDGTFRKGVKIAMSPYSRYTSTSAGPFTTEGTTNNHHATRMAQIAWANANPTIAALGPTVNDMKIEAAGGPHQDLSSVRGSPRFAIRMAEAALRALGVSELGSPYFAGTATFTDAGKTAFDMPVVIPHIGRLRTDDEATYNANVQGFEISVDSGATWSRSGFTAAIQGTTARRTVRVTKSSGDWTALSAGQLRVRYQFGGPYSDGTSVESTERFRGGLYGGAVADFSVGGFTELLDPVLPLDAVIVA